MISARSYAEAAGLVMALREAVESWASSAPSGEARLMPVGFATAMDRSPCPCGGGLYIHCCAPLHRYDRRAATAEQLMRSRYSAFVRGEVDYLMATHPSPSSLWPVSDVSCSRVAGRSTGRGSHHSHSGGWLAGCGRNGFVRSLSSRGCVARDLVVPTPPWIHHGRLALRQGCLHRSLKS